MTTRERFRRVMAGDAAVDRLPAIEWAYWWDKTLELWYGQGLPRGLDEAAMADFVGIDRNTQFWLPHKIPDCPRETSHGRGIVENESDYERLRPYLLPENAVQQMLPKIRQTLPFYENGQTLVWYTLDGFFWWPRTLLGIENHLYSFPDGKSGIDGFILFMPSRSCITASAKICWNGRSRRWTRWPVI